MGLLLLIYQCRRRPNKKDRSKDYEMDSMRPAKVTPQNQAPPPYYPSSGMENKALEHSMDMALSMDDSKTAVYATQGGYSYHVPPHTQPHPGQTMPNSDCEYLNMFCFKILALMIIFVLITTRLKNIILFLFTYIFISIFDFITLIYFSHTQSLRTNCNRHRR